MTSSSSENNEGPEKETISFEEGDPGNPYNWSRARKLYIVLLGTLTILVSTVLSALPSGVEDDLQKHFHVTVEAQLVLPISVFLAGYVLGPFLFAPISESYGRRYIFLATYSAMTVFTMATALAPNWPAFLVFRFLTGLFASTPISNTGGLFADVYGNPIYRGRAMAWYLFVASAGPSLGPIPSGYLSVFGWQWTFWFGLILAGSCLIPVLFLPETYGPAILMYRAKKMRKQQPGCNVYASLELQHMGPRQFVTKVLGRPMKMLVSEPIVTASCLYLSLIYGIIFILFQAFPVIFPPIYSFSPGETGLAFLGLVVGNALSLPVCFYWDSYLQSAKRKNKAWSQKEEFQRLPLAVLGGPMFAIGMFWIGWTSRKSIHWIVPILGGLPLGFGFVIVFNALFNYLVDSYKIYSASALGATSISRSTFGVVLPLAAKPMYKALGIGWACSLLGFLSLLMCLIPPAFIMYGERLRMKSPLCQELAGRTEQARKADEKTDVEKDKQ